MAQVTVNKGNPSIAIALAVQYLKEKSVDVSLEYGTATSLSLTSGGKVTEPSTILRYLARSSDCGLYGADPLESAQVDQRVDFAHRKFHPGLLKELDAALAGRTFFVGHGVTLADLATFGFVEAHKEQLAKFADLNRWFTSLSAQPVFKAALESVPQKPAAPTAAQASGKKEGKKDEGGKFIELPGAKIGEVVVRFPPEASGYLHIGHAKAALLNQFYQINYKGKLVMRFDDTNPAKEDEHFEQVILDDVKLLNIKPDMFTCTSDHFDVILDYAKKLIKDGFAFCDDTEPEEMKKMRERRDPSQYRESGVEDNLKRFAEMEAGSTEGQRWCLRAKINHKSDNGCLRDPTIFRCRNEPHVKTGTKYKAYPTYDFACPIVDSREGVTHALRTTEYHDRDDQFEWFLKKLDLRHVNVWEYSRLTMVHTVMSKRKLKWFVEEGRVDGWDDPRFPTVRGILRRGLTVEGLKQFIISQGSSRANVHMEWDKIWAVNRRVIDPIAPRYTALLEKDIVPLILDDDVAPHSKSVARHPKNAEVGEKTVWFNKRVLLDGADAQTLADGQRITLINWGNAQITGVTKNGDKIVELKAKLLLEDKNFKDTVKLTWLSDVPDQAFTPTVCTFFDNLITKEVLTKEDNFREFINDKTKWTETMVSDPCMRDIKKGDIIQLQRRGFFICDEAFQAASGDAAAKPCVLFAIPDGHSKTATGAKAAKTDGAASSKQSGSARKKGEEKAEKAPKDEAPKEKAPKEQAAPKAAAAPAEAATATAAPKSAKAAEKAAAKEAKAKAKEAKAKAAGGKDGKAGKGAAAAGADSKKVTRLGMEVKKGDDFAEWYTQVITKSQMIEYYDVSGCYVIRPWAFSIWELIQSFFDSEIKKLGVENASFPMFVSQAALEREKDHIADFAPEVAWVTKSGKSDLAEPIAIRPTSETSMYPCYAKWIQSHRDLPLKINQWNSVVRWEFKHPQPFLRTREFLWQEGHTAFAEKAEAEEEVLTILDLYARVYEELMAVPVVKGRKSEKEKFAGGDFTTTVEAFIPTSGRGIQGATSHHLGQNFSKMFDIVIEDPKKAGEKLFVFQNSWGITTRTIGVMCMVHGDDKGLVLPPRLARRQVVIVPCGITAKTSPEDEKKLIESCRAAGHDLQDGGIRVQVDDRDNYSPGWKFNDWELKGVPIRVEIGPKDLEKGQVTAVIRHSGEKVAVKRDSNLSDAMSDMLFTIQKQMFEKAQVERDAHIKTVTTWSEFCSLLEQKNLLLAPFCGVEKCEDLIKKESARTDDAVAVDPNAPAMGAKSLCIPLEQNELPAERKCIQPSCSNSLDKLQWTLFGRSY